MSSKKIMKNPKLKFLFFKYLGFLKFIFVLSTLNFLVAEPIWDKTTFVRGLKDCFSDIKPLVCKQLILQAEKLQLYEYNQKNFKCQTSLLGVQTKLIGKIYFGEKTYFEDPTVSYLIKNC
tara:strand:- start:7991 stop:8350 length:360 start_codon:yes stop_codon:yes gene_type:complete